jgi:membrane-associated phospholipid phosphatase
MATPPPTVITVEKLAVVVNGEASTPQMRRLLLAAAVASLGLTAIRLILQLLPLRFDVQYSAVLYLMWPRGVDKITQTALYGWNVVSFGLPLVLICAAVLPARRLAIPSRVLRWAYRYAIIVPLVALTALSFSRLMSNVLYAAAVGVSADYTPAIVRLEHTAITRIQRSMESAVLSDACQALYSAGWLIGLLSAVPLLLAEGRTRAAGRLLIAWVLAPMLALPLFLLFPVFEPWALNPAYGYSGIPSTLVRFLGVPSPSTELLWVATKARWATGACLPSLHVTLPLLAALIAFDSRARRVGWLYTVLAAMTGFVVVYLGRHWIVDVAAAVPFAWAIAQAVRRLDPRLVLVWPQSAAGG